MPWSLPRSEAARGGYIKGSEAPYGYATGGTGGMTFILLSLIGLLRVTVYFDRDLDETLRRLLKYSFVSYKSLKSPCLF